MSQNGQKHFKKFLKLCLTILEYYAARFLKCAWPFRDITLQDFESVSDHFGTLRCKILKVCLTILGYHVFNFWTTEW